MLSTISVKALVILIIAVSNSWSVNSSIPYTFGSNACLFSFFLFSNCMFCLLVCPEFLLDSRHDVLVSRSSCEQALSNVMVSYGRREAFYTPVLSLSHLARLCVRTVNFKNVSQFSSPTLGEKDG